MCSRLHRWVGVIVVVAIAGCISQSESTEVRPGVRVITEYDELPRPPSEYEIYLVGEHHNQREIHELFCYYVEILHEKIGVRDIVLEAQRFHRKEFTDHVRGRSDAPDTHFNLILNRVKELNESLPKDEKIRVHPVDVDWSIPTIQTHLRYIKEDIGTPADHVEIPSVNDEPLGITSLSRKKDRLTEIVEQLADTDAVNMDIARIRNELDTVDTSLDWVARKYRAASIREEQIVANIQYVTQEYGSVVALYGCWHARKTTRMALESAPWAQRLTAMGVPLYTIMASTINPDLIEFANGTTARDLVDTNTEWSMVYINLHVETEVVCVAESLADLGCYNPEVPLSDAFDAFILFKETKPLHERGGENKGVQD